MKFILVTTLVILLILNETHQSCITCDSKVDTQKDCGFITVDDTALYVADCVDSSLGCYAAIYEVTDDDYPGWYTKRGCMESIGIKECEDDSCKKCTDNNCNANVFPTDRKKCLKCSADGCDSPKNEYCYIYTSSFQGCATLFDDNGNVIHKNCISDLPNSTKELCDDSSYLDCKRCSNENCNTDNQREGTKCYKCVGAECLIPGIDDLVDCRSSCYIGLNSKGEIVRGCASDFSNINLCSTTDDSSSKCFVCEGDRCNSIVYPINGRLQCHTCLYNDCVSNDDDIKYCTRFHQDEKCITIFSEMEDKVIARGCYSDMEPEEMNTCTENSTNCLQCSYNKCNNDESKLKTEFCIGCNSQDDFECVKGNSNMQIRCLADECFTRLSASSYGKHLERGCLSDLLTNCSEPNCKRCSGRNCNNQLFPNERISCKFCDLESCQGNAVDKICNQYIENESCITFYGQENEVIYRDCYADTQEETRELCDDETNLQCTKCTGNLCNTDTTRRGNKCFKCHGTECFYPQISSDTFECLSDCFVGLDGDGYIIRDCAIAIEGSNACGVTDESCLRCNDDLCNGILFPIEDRLTCVKCIGDQCQQPDVTSDFCERFHSTERCVSIFDDSDNVIERGCSSTIQNKEMCNESDYECLQCNFNDCNTEMSVKDKFHCVSCKSNLDAGCVSADLTKTIGCESECYTRIFGQYTERGCSSELEDCPEGSCALCSGEKCNSEVFPVKRHSCFHCFDDRCELGYLDEKICENYNSSNDNCITIYGGENEIIYRDCYVDAINGTRDVCDDSSDLSCSKCSGKLCNSDKQRRGTKCFKCNGIDCFNAEYPANVVDCLSNCYVGVNQNGETQRDCASSLTTENCARNDMESKNCLVCESDLCNSIIYPLKDRLICKHCLGEFCEYGDVSDEYCEKLHQDERCVSVFGSSGKIIERGCSSTVQNAEKCSVNDSNCVKCNFNECNVHETSSENNFCVSCSSINDPGCVDNSSNPSIKICPTNQCYSKLLSSLNGSQHIEKGCAADITTESTVCTGDRCNNILYPADRFSCMDCRGEACKNSVIPSKVCLLYNSQQQACVTLYDNRNEVNYRGCYADAALGTKEVCDDPTQLLCTKCRSKNCNQDSLRRGNRCMKCQGLECFKTVTLADVVDCTTNCYVGVNSQGETVRDCSSSIANTTSCRENDDGVNRCHICSDDLCNSISFPITNRLECHSCLGDGCLPSDDNLEYCARYHRIERCVTVFSNNDVIERGCSSSLQNKLYCNQNYQSCVECPSTGCNNITTITTRSCAVCDSSLDRNCILNPVNVTVKECEKGCYTRLVSGGLLRGCMEDLGNFQCIEANQCQFCNDVDKCNVHNYPANRQSCETCDGINNCSNVVNRLCFNHKPNDQCVTIFDGYRVSMKGCFSDMTLSDQGKCNSTANPLCISCTSRNCNIETVRKDENCIVCNSGLDSNCSQKPETLHAEHCLLSSGGECFTRILNGATARGCAGALTASELSQCRSNSNSSQCLLTTGQGTNNKIYPENRLECYHCDSRINAECFDSFDKDHHQTLTCKIFSQPEQCLKLNIKNNVIRGCLADFSDNVCREGKCSTCNNEKGCNESSSLRFNILLLLLSLVIYFVTKNH